MSMLLHNLDPRTRQLMQAEVQHDLAKSALFVSNRLSDAGRVMYVSLLVDAIQRGDTSSFAVALSRPGLLNPYELSHSRKGTPYPKSVPHNAHVTLAEGEFNRFYIRGLCARAVQDGIECVEIYRAKVVGTPRHSSESRIGRLVIADAVLADLRANIGVEPALKIPGGPNSGLSVRLPANSNVAR